MIFYGKEEARAGWYNGSWTYRKAVTVQSSKVETTETSFPVLVSVTDPDLKSTGNGGHVSQVNGYDIIFTDDDGVALLDFEIESWNDETGEIQAWVETDISTTVDKVIYMYYGNSSATDLSDAAGVWDDNFVMVQHLQETDLDAGTGDIKDSTANANDGTTNENLYMSEADYDGDGCIALPDYAIWYEFYLESNLEGDLDNDGDVDTDDYDILMGGFGSCVDDGINQVAGQIDGSFEFDGNNVNCGTNDSLYPTGAMTVSAWIKISVADRPVISVWEGGGGAERWILKDGMFKYRNAADTSDTWRSFATTMSDGQWHNIVAVVNPLSATINLYRDGTLDNGAFANNGVGWHTDKPAVEIGAGGGFAFIGIIDEVRISNVARTAGRIETEYNNQSSPETFLAFSSEERDVYYLMQSDNYKIEKDSINFGGMDDGQSTNYKLSDTMGEIGTGFSESSTYQVNAGYRQMSETYLAITSPTDVTMSPDIGGVSGGTGNGQAVWTVTTDSSGGYSLDIKASSASALQSGANSFADYTLAVAGTPDYTWSVVAADSEFGFTPEGNDIVSKFKDNGTDACNTGSNDTADKCWSNFSISYENIASSSDPNHPDGTATTVKFRAESGTSHLQVEGSYQATVTVTAVAL